MSIVIDGIDILKRYSTASAVVAEGLDYRLCGENREIPAGAIACVNRLFSRGIDYIREVRGQKPINKDPRAAREFGTAYLMLKDMLRKIRVVDDQNIDSKLEDIANTLEILTPSGNQVRIAREGFQEVRDLLRKIADERQKYAYPKSHSPYSIGTFNDNRRRYSKLI